MSKDQTKVMYFSWNEYLTHILLFALEIEGQKFIKVFQLAHFQ